MPVTMELLQAREFVGTVDWIGYAPARRKDHVTPDSIDVREGYGIEGNHHAGNPRRRNRQVTLIQAEHLLVMASILGKDQIDPSLLRRNVVVSGINLRSLKKATFRIGTAVLKGTGDCAPCALMDENLGPGGCAAMIDHGGITTTIVESGTICLGDSLSVLEYELAGLK